MSTIETAVPAYETDMFSDEVVTDPLPHYARLRELGPVVWLPATNVYAMPRYDETREILGDAETFISGKGVGFNDLVNEISQGSTLVSDNPLHDQLRAVVASELTPRALRTRREEITEKANKVVAAAVAKQVIDAVPEFSQAMPMAVVPDFIGIPEDSREHLFEWSAAALDSLGSGHSRLQHAFDTAATQFQYAIEVSSSGRTLDNSLIAGVLAAIERGEIPPKHAPNLMIDYLGPSMETTSSALGHLLVLLARNPEQWELLRSNPALVSAAIEETLRLEPPLRGFSRLVSKDTVVAGVPLEAGARVWPIIASANRDRLKWGDDADEFKIERNPVDQISFGYGVHGCAGQGLARMEIHAIIHALIDQVDHLELAGEPEWLLHSFANTYKSLPLRLVAR